MSDLSLDEKMRIDREIAEMKKHPIDYSDIPQSKGGKIRLPYQKFLDMLPPDILKEMAERRIAEMKEWGYVLPEEEKV
jgi:hypothetical protein